MRRVVVTGLGMVSPLGCGVEPTWKRILNGESGASQIDTFDVVGSRPARSPAWFRAATAATARFNPDQWMEPKDQRKVDDFIIFAMCRGAPGARRCRLASRRPKRTAAPPAS